MYARESRFFVDPARVAEAHAGTVPFIGRLKGLDGCQSAVFYTPTDEELVVVSVWASEAQARAADSLRDQAVAELGALWTKPPVTVIGPTIE